MLVSRDGLHQLLFIEVPGTKVAKNRLHMDLEPVEGTRDAWLSDCWNVARSRSATIEGSTVQARAGWSQQTQKESDFCILRRQPERSA